MKYSWIYDILPYIERQDIYDQWDTKNDGAGGCYLDISITAGTGKRPAAGSGAIDGLSGTELRVLVCPADTTTTTGQGNLSYVVNGGFSPH